MPSPEAKARLAKLFEERDAAANRPAGHTRDDWRREWEATARADELVAGTRIEAILANGVPAEWIATPGIETAHALLWLHGGGYEAGSPITHRKMASLLSRAARVPVLVPDYRLAPEHPFPAALDDALTAYAFLQAHGYATRDLAVGGDSAGGGLALSMLLALRDRGEALPCAAAVMSPWTDLTASGASYRQFAADDPIISQAGLAAAGLRYAGTTDPRDPVASPVFSDPRGLPPLLIQAGGIECMLDDSRVFAQRARAAGVDVTLTICEGMWHVHQFHAPEVPEATASYEEIGTFLARFWTGEGRSGAA